MNYHQCQIHHGRGKSRYRYGQPDKNYVANGFTCAHCHGFVYTNPGLSGIYNRNHCPYCLWSRHLDLYLAGDRLSACKSLMQPIGLTVKLTRKKYGSGRGELMLIHACQGCKILSINRIAADDDPQMVFSIFEDSIHLNALTHARLEEEEIFALDASDRNMVHIQLFGQEETTAMLFAHSTAAKSV